MSQWTLGVYQVQAGTGLRTSGESDNVERVLVNVAYVSETMSTLQKDETVILQSLLRKLLLQYSR